LGCLDKGAAFMRSSALAALRWSWQQFAHCRAGDLSGIHL